MNYGVRITLVTWAAIDGGPDLHGTKEEMEAVADRWRNEEHHQDASFTYEVVPYTGVDPADQETVESFLKQKP